jgi:quercetin dioxygenase-like cupin family protein
MTASRSNQGLSPAIVGSIRPEDVAFRPFAAFPEGAMLAVVVGNPAEPGPYVVRVRVPAGTRLMPHTHPEDRIYTVISGVFYIGYGTIFDPDMLHAYGVGSVVVLPANTPHFHWAKSGEYVTQVTGFGPLGIEYHDRRDDPREAGGEDA